MRRVLEPKLILHLCADIGSDSRFYALDEQYEVIRVGKDIGVENYTPPSNVYGIIANPPCTEFSTARANGKSRNPEEGMFLVEQCLRIIEECNPEFWMMENPARGDLKKYLGKPKHTYQPWQYGSPWTKHTALWGDFNMPEAIYEKWDDVPKNKEIYVRPSRPKPSLAFLHKSAVDQIEEFRWARDLIKCDADLRSMCSQGFARSFYMANK